MKRIQITMQHSEDTVRRLAKVQYNTFSAFGKIFWYAVCILCIATGVGLIGSFNDTVNLLLVAFGAIVIVNIGASGKLRADKTIAAVKASGSKYPRTTLAFESSGIQVTEHTDKSANTTLTYSSIIRLTEDDAYWYLFINKVAAYMLPKDSIQSPDEREKFVAMLEKKTGLTMSEPFNLMQLRLKLFRPKGKKKRG